MALSDMDRRAIDAAYGQGMATLFDNLWSELAYPNGVTELQLAAKFVRSLKLLKHTKQLLETACESSQEA